MLNRISGVLSQPRARALVVGLLIVAGTISLVSQQASRPHVGLGSEPIALLLLGGAFAAAAAAIRRLPRASAPQPSAAWPVLQGWKSGTSAPGAAPGR